MNEDGKTNLELKDRLILSLDVSSKNELNRICKSTNNKISTIKLGLEAIYSQGLGVIDTVKSYGYKVMLDAKLMDIPNTVKKAMKAILLKDVHSVTMHLLGGRDMIKTSREYIDKIALESNKTPPLVFGVSVLTSLGDKDLKELGFDNNYIKEVNILAKIGLESGINGIVCSPNEANGLRKLLGDDILVATPGVRLADDKNSDQKRVNTPDYSIRQGADILIVGRPITQSEDISTTIDIFLEKIKGVLEN